VDAKGGAVQVLVRVGLAAVVVALSAGCTTVYPGTAVRDPHEDPRAVNPALLDPGSFPTKPRPPLGAAGTPAAAALIESRRMAENTVLGFQVDPALNDPRYYETGPVVNASAISSFTPGAIPQAINGHNLIAGWANSAGTKEFSDFQVHNVVLRFAAEADAAATAAAMLAAGNTMTRQDENNNPVPTPVVPAAIPGHPDAGAFTFDAGGWTSLIGVTAHGPYVLLQVIWNQDPGAAITAAAKTLDLQVPLIDQFAPTPAESLAALPVDPSGLLARTLPPPPDQESPKNGTYGPHGALSFMTDPPRTQKLFDAAGMQTMVLSMVNVYLVRDAAAAGKVEDDFIAEMLDRKSTAADGIPGMSAARCVHSAKDPVSITPQYFYCVATTDRYAIEASGLDNRDVHQMVAAQYLMLTAK
jgi:hypothetical protein